MAETKSDDQPLLVDLVSDAVAAGQLGVCKVTLARWRRSGNGPRFVKIGRRVFYRLDALKAWLAAQEAGSTAEKRARSA